MNNELYCRFNLRFIPTAFSRPPCGPKRNAV